jgi:acyl-CoA reductase-like NAD-dependent aldehyde dehydrogenase
MRASEKTPENGEVPGLRARIRWLRRFRKAVSREREALCGLIEADMGKPAVDAMVQDIVPLLSACVWLERNAGRVLRERRVGWGGVWSLGQSHRVRRVPLGTVGIIATWNYPVQLLGVQLAQALVAGNRVVVKPSENAPRTQRRLLELANEASRADGSAIAGLSWTDASREAGARTLREHRFDHMAFTGSTGVGRSIAEWAAGTLTATTLELSGNDSAFVLDDADAALASRSIWAGITMNAGQTCMAPHRALVMRGVYDAFLRHLSALAASAKPVAMVNAAAAERAWEVARSSVGTPGRAARSLSGVLEPARGRFFTPAAIVDCGGDEPAVAGEHFGPLLAVVPVDSIEHALRIHRACRQHLSVSVYSRDTRAAKALAERLGAGIVTINDTVFPSGHPGIAVSGHGESGWGASRGAEGLLAMTRAVHISVTSRWVRTPVEPMTAKMGKAISGLVGWLYGGGTASPDHSPHALPHATASSSPTAIESKGTEARVLSGRIGGAEAHV